ncbi:MAG: ABC transporter substrate-binding protein [Eubacteriales bacterium]|nr:ABC transporter substrate-binding protein [Eubacteriales bacterium]
MKKILALVMVVVMVAGLFMVLPVKAADEGNVAGDTIKIGWIGSLTGDQSVFGICERDTIKMLIDQVNEEEGGIAGKKVEFIAYDTKGTPEEAVNAVNRLVTSDKVQIILGPNSSGLAIPIASILEKGKVADIATVATNEKVTVDRGKLKPYNFRVCFIDPYQGAVAATYAFKEAEAKTAAILSDISDEYSQGMAEYFKKTFEELGGEVVAEEAFKTGDTDFRAQLTKIKEKEPEVVFLPYFYKEVALTVKQADELGIKTTYMGGDGWTSDQLMEMAGPYLQGCYIVNHVDFDDPDVQDFKDQFAEAYPDAPMQLNAYMGHDAFVTAKAAIEKVAEENDGVISSAAIAKALEGIEVQGITGKILISPETHNPEGKEAAIITIDGEDYKFVRKYSADITDDEEVKEEK